MEKTKCWGDVIQRSFLTVCHYISFYFKTLVSFLTGTLGSDYSAIAFENNSTLSESDKQQVLSGITKLKPSSEIPGPKSLPLFGTLFEFGKYGASRLHDLVVDRHAQYGGIFWEKLFAQELVFLADTDLMKQWMIQEGRVPTSVKQEPSFVFGEMFPQLKRGLFFRDGEEWYKLRKMAHHILHKNASEFEPARLFDGCEDFFDEYMKDLKQEVRESEDGLVDVEIKSYEVAVGALMTLMYGGNMNRLQDLVGIDFHTISKNARDLNECHQQLLESPVRLAKWLRMPAWTGFATRLHRNLTACLKYSRLLREEILKSPENASMRTHGLLYKTIDMNSDLQDIDDLLADFAVDTKDPFAGTVMFVTHCLGMYSDAQEKIRQEVAQIFPDNEPITYVKCKHLEYTEAFFKEAVRLYPVAVCTARVALEDTVIGEYLLKPGTMIMYSAYAAQRDPKYFPDPLKFLPERWINCGTTGNDKVLDPNAFAGFGLKNRLCIGQNVAISIFSMYLAHLVRNFTLTAEKLGPIALRTVLYPVNQKPIHFQIR